MSNTRKYAAAIVVISAALLAACGSKPVDQPPPPPRRTVVAAASVVASASASAAPIVFNEADFTASDRNRDPFRAFAEIFANQVPDRNRPTVMVSADRFSLDELKLVAIVTGNAAPKAMFIDPEGKGWIITLGQLVGRSELVKSGGAGSAEYDLNWRVDRIREGDVVFVRENPGRSNVPTATRVIALRPEGDAQVNHHRLAAVPKAQVRRAPRDVAKEAVSRALRRAKPARVPREFGPFDPPLPTIAKAPRRDRPHEARQRFARKS